MNKMDERKTVALTNAVSKCLRDSPQTQIVFATLMAHLAELYDELEMMASQAPGLRDRIGGITNATEDLRLAMRAAVVDDTRIIH